MERLRKYQRFVGTADKTAFRLLHKTEKKRGRAVGQLFH
jgi:hypothetical protein